MDHHGPVRVASIPARHAYVDAVRPGGVVAVVAAGADVPDDLGWAPDPLWQLDGLPQRLAGTDVVHVHFGFDDLTPDHLRVWAEAVHAAGTALVVTVHDLRNPHHARADTHDAQLTALLGAADAVLTLTPGAATVIERRFGRRAEVVPHPAIFDGPAEVPADAPTHGSNARGAVGLLLKPWRASVLDPVAIAEVVARAASFAGGWLRVDLNDDHVDPELVTALRSAVEPAGGQVAVRPRLDDEALRRYLTSLHVTVLPNRFGTHSGWVEAAHDVGTTAVVPTCGFYAEQWDAVVPYRHDEDHGFDPASLDQAVRTALTAPSAAPADREWRADQRAAVRAAHETIYARVTAERATGSGRPSGPLAAASGPPAAADRRRVNRAPDAPAGTPAATNGRPA